MSFSEYIWIKGGEAYVLWMGLEPWLWLRVWRRLLGRRLEPRLRLRLAWRLGLVINLSFSGL